MLQWTSHELERVQRWIPEKNAGESGQLTSLTVANVCMHAILINCICVEIAVYTDPCMCGAFHCV